MKKNWNQSWKFTKDPITIDTEKSVLLQGTWKSVCLPHTWNGSDGQDGGNDYYRGICFYQKILCQDELCREKVIYLEFEGANSSADLYVNGLHVAHHDGGYSTWRANITDYLKMKNEIVVAVDNSFNDQVYPQMADFTFYGGLYRNVNLLLVNTNRFDLDYLGGPGIRVVPTMEGQDAVVSVEARVTGDDDAVIIYQIEDENDIVAAQCVPAKQNSSVLRIPNAHLWNGIKDPFLYTLRAVLKKDEEILDERILKFGCRSYQIDPEKGFLLNGIPYPLRGVARHQDRPIIGNALLPEHHLEDIELILEMGANSVRCSHYQHDSFFMDLCDQKGLVVWAEIPYISAHMPNARENALSQMKELIIQNAHRPSIVVWGLSNEITMHNVEKEDMMRNHRELQKLVHTMDPTRKTAIAVISSCSMNDPYLLISDTVAYNLYYGWYVGDTDMNGSFLDAFHKKYPNIPIGLSEYGCEALNWHSSHPEPGDYTEEYQAHYHEELIKQLTSRTYIWASYVWNMFDFAADSRSEGGEDGMNHKGLVSFDRKYKKDAFYAYKAWLSPIPFVHISGKRYVNRVENVTKVTVYSNQPEVELFVNDKSIGISHSNTPFFYFEVPNRGESQLIAKAGNCRDTATLRKVEVFDETYRLKETGDVLNWFEIDTPEGYFSILDKMEDIQKNVEASTYFQNFLQERMKHGKKHSATEKRSPVGAYTDMVAKFTVKRMLTLAQKMTGAPVTRELMLEVNHTLNKIKK